MARTLPTTIGPMCTWSQPQISSSSHQGRLRKTRESPGTFGEERTITYPDCDRDPDIVYNPQLLCPTMSQFTCASNWTTLLSRLPCMIYGLEFPSTKDIALIGLWVESTTICIVLTCRCWATPTDLLQHTTTFYS